MCREQLRKRWQHEYLKALQERYQKLEDSGQTLLDIGNIVFIVEDNNPKVKWNLGKIIEDIKGRDGVMRGYKIRNKKEYTIERLLQWIRDLRIKTSSNKIDRTLTKSNEHAKVDERTTLEQKAKMEARNQIIAVNLQNDNELWRISHRRIFTLIEGVCWNSSRRIETVDKNCWVEELLFKGTITDYS